MATGLSVFKSLRIFSSYTKQKPLEKHENGLTNCYLLSWRNKITIIRDKKLPLESAWIHQNFEKFMELYEKLHSIFDNEICYTTKFNKFRVIKTYSALPLQG